MTSRSSFGTIVAVLGSCLVALGVAWLIAQNWQSMPSPLKVAVLAVATFGTLAAAVLLRRRDHEGIGAALLVLASLLFALSVFLVAQIFSTDVGLQGNAWLTALAVIGVLAIAYGLDSRASLVVGLSGVLVWLLLQFLAVADDDAGYLLALLFLGAGLLFYALKLLHRERFSTLYRVWTVLYLLLFGYLLSFQSLLTLLGGPAGWDAGTAFVTGLWAVALALAAVAWLRQRRREAPEGGPPASGAPPRREVVVAAAIFATLLALLLACRWVADVGLARCEPVPCWRLAENACTDSPACDWNGRACRPHLLDLPDTCSPHPDAVACAADPGCRWDWALADGCAEIEPWCNAIGSSCADQIRRCADSDYAFQPCAPFADDCWRLGLSRDDCVARLAACTVTEACRPVPAAPCSQVLDMALCRVQPSCRWEDGACRDADVCAAVDDPATCEADPRCTWQQLRSLGGDAPAGALALWIVVNLVFLAVILLVVGYGSWLGDSTLINLGIAFFALDVVTRYIGFVIDFWGYASLSLVFIVGGVLLLFGGFKLEQWRRRLIRRS